MIKLWLQPLMLSLGRSVKKCLKNFALKNNKVQIIATLGPATNTEEAVRKLKASGVDFVRINMSHSTTDDLRYFIGLAKKVSLPFIVDTEGSQIRTGELKKGIVQN